MILKDLMKQIQFNKIGLVDDPNKADTVIINTCGFIEAAKEESINTILECSCHEETAARLKKLLLQDVYQSDTKKIF
ncbi:MAG: hypothetical protein MZV64_40635 [Ignavibacteriales bacterium]|nr:hypothetical protein [Ignavibacteriales bacterium]